MVDDGGLRQAGHAGGEDIERVIVEGDVAMLIEAEPGAGELLDIVVDAGKPRRGLAFDP